MPEGRWEFSGSVFFFLILVQTCYHSYIVNSSLTWLKLSISAKQDCTAEFIKGLHLPPRVSHLIGFLLLDVLLQKVYETHDHSRDHIFMADTKTVISYIKDTHSSNDEKLSDFFSLVSPLSATLYSLQYTLLVTCYSLCRFWTTKLCNQSDTVVGRDFWWLQRDDAASEPKVAPF